MKSSTQLSALLKRVDSINICPGIGAYNMFSEIGTAYRCGNTWISNACHQLVEDGSVCDTCNKAITTLRKLADSKLRRSQTLSSGGNKDKKFQKSTKTYSRSIHRLKSRVISLKSSLKIIQRQFVNSDATLLERAINNELSLSPQMRMAMITAAHSAKSKSKHGMRSVNNIS